MKKALITGISGQDGYFLTKLLLQKGYEVFGFCRDLSQLHPDFIAAFQDKVELIQGNIINFTAIHAAVAQSMPDEIYNLASQSRPAYSWKDPATTLMVNGIGAVHLFESVKQLCPEARVCHASSSELFGHQMESPQNEDTPFNPCNPYAASKACAHQMAKIYRDNYQMFIANAILFNHESEYRSISFVAQKIAYGAACAALGISNSPLLNEIGTPIVANGKLALGNLDTARDWGYAQDYVHAMWLMLQHEKGDDFVIGTGQLHTLAYLCTVAYNSVGLDASDHIVSDTNLLRPKDSCELIADAYKAKRILGWAPSISFETMIEKMVEAQMQRLRSIPLWQGHEASVTASSSSVYS